MEPLALVVGSVLLVLGAVGATLAQRRFEEAGRATRAPLALVPFGVLIGAGAALIRGWDLAVAIAVGAVLVPLVGVVGRLVEVRRARRRLRREADTGAVQEDDGPPAEGT